MDMGLAIRDYKLRALRAVMRPGDVRLGAPGPRRDTAGC
jgi:hypothetical protein